MGVEAAQSDKPAAGQVCTLTVEGRACSACATKVEKTALKIEGVKAAKVNQPKGIAEITFDAEKVSPKAIAKPLRTRRASRLKWKSRNARYGHRPTCLGEMRFDTSP